MLPYTIAWLRGRDVDGIYCQSVFLHWVARFVCTLYDIPLVSYFGYTPTLRDGDSISLKLVLERINFKFFTGEIVLCRAPNVRRVIDARSRHALTVDVIHGILNEEKLRSAIERPTAELRSKYLRGDSKRLLVFVGRLTTVKNPTALIDVMIELPDSYTLAIVGDGPMRGMIERMIKEKALGERIALAGELSHSEALRHIAAGDALVLTSHAEAYPTVVFEALALGTTVFAPPVGILPTLNEDNLYLVAPGRINDEIRKVDPEGTTLDEEILQRYSISRYTSQVLEAFEEVQRTR